MAKKKNIVKRQKGSMQAILIAMTAVGWLMAIIALTRSSDGVKEQKALIEEAQGLLEDKLYVRVVQTYQRALSDYQTENNLTYETQLLEIYKEAEMTDEYYALIDKRIGDGTASADEVKVRVTSYLDDDNQKEAVALLKQCADRYDDRELTDLYESLRYAYQTSVTTFTQLEQPGEDWFIPAFNEETGLWGYIRDNGTTAIGFQYDEALPFEGDYAVVREAGGGYVLIGKDGYRYTVDKIGLDQVTAYVGGKIAGAKDGKYGIFNNSFQALKQEHYEDVCLNDNGMVFVKQDGKWALLDSSLEKITDPVFTDIARNSRGQAFSGDYALAADEKGFYVIDKSGKACFNARFPMVKGLEGGNFAASDASGKWGFVNIAGEYVLEPQYEDAFSFSNSLAAVKIDEKWGYINGYGDLIIEAQYSAAYPFFSGKALAADEEGYYQILKLKY